MIKPFNRTILYEFSIGGIVGLPAWIESLDSLQPDHEILPGIHKIWLPPESLSFGHCIRQIPGRGFGFNDLKRIAREGARSFLKVFGNVHLIAPDSVAQVRSDYVSGLDGQVEAVHGLMVSGLGLLTITACPVNSPVVPGDVFGYYPD